MRSNSRSWAERAYPKLIHYNKLDKGGQLARSIFGNDVAIISYREGKLPFPDCTIIARLAWSYEPSEENKKAFGRPNRS